MIPRKIKHAIEDAGETQTAIAARRGVSATMVNKVVHKHKRAAHIEREIAKTIKRDLHEIFPEWYSRLAS